MTQIETEIIREITLSLELLGATSDLLGVVASFKTTLPDAEVLSSIQTWNQTTRNIRAAADFQEMLDIVQRAANPAKLP